jgi:hypothetical protein
MDLAAAAGIKGTVEPAPTDTKHAPDRAVQHAYRPKRAPRERKAQAVAITGPAVVTTTKRGRGKTTAWVAMTARRLRQR